MLRRLNGIPAPVLLALAVAGGMLMVACGSDPVSPAAPDPAVAAPPAGDLDATPEEGSFAASSSSEREYGFACTFEAVGQTLTTTRSSAVKSWTGKETVTCRGTVDNAPSSTRVEYGQPCYLPLTDDWSTNSKVSTYPSGSTKLRCQGK